MSIINEALKKTEQHLQKNAALNIPLPQEPLHPKSFLIYVLILLAGILLGNFIFTLLKHKTQPRVIPIKNILPVTKTIEAPTLAVLPSQPLEENKPLEANFILNGIFFSDEDGYALVNNQIVRENDFIDGAKVSSITANTVTLDNAGQTITLNTSR